MMNVVQEEQQLLTVRDVCQRLQVRKEWVYAAVKRGDLPRFKIGKELRFSAAELEAYLASTRETG